MNAMQMKEELHRFIETVEEKRMKTIYALFEKEIKEDEWEYTDEFKEELDRRYNYYINGGKMISAKDADKQTKDLLKKLRS